MSISAIGSLAQSLVPGQSARQVTPALGLGFRFTVTIDGLGLGEWQACSGLSVDFQPLEVKSGSDYLGSRYLAGEAKYGRVVLKRAASLATSGAVQDWLDTRAVAWMIPPAAGGAPAPGAKTAAGKGDSGLAVIMLYDSNDTAVLRWDLEGVRPAAWKGPDLDATSSRVAIETLELVHEGFTVSPGKVKKRSLTRPHKQLTLTGSGKTVTFDYAPVKVTVTRNQDAGLVQDHSTVDGQNAVGGETGAMTGLQLNGRPNVTAYTFANLILEGANVVTAVGTLLDWSTKTKVGTSPEASLPLVDFALGSGLTGTGLNLTSLSVQYTRFDANGTPNRAMVSTLKLEEPKREGAQGASGGSTSHPGTANPTSGGIPGRSVHVLSEPESLPGLAQQTYGDADAWRDIAAANGIDDPMRVRPGTPLLLPARSERGPR